ncbi:MAG TPA: RnfABCDGE type electron transport complex subunit D, partial [Candidatus Omnitrophota bacterium]|nr:RnfABCDGE type electron transport complex subunit D [Candidatus Omnitrophota bacterium]
MKKVETLFAKGKPLAKLYPVYEALDTFLLTPGTKTQRAPYIRDAIDLKRVMISVVVALFPCIVMGIYNTGYQIQMASAAEHSWATAFGQG